jgi:hypothetical protein
VRTPQRKIRISAIRLTFPVYSLHIPFLFKKIPVLRHRELPDKSRPDRLYSKAGSLHCPEIRKFPGILAQTHLLDFDAAGELGHKLNSLVEVTR